MLDNFITKGEMTRRNTNMVIQKIAENNMDWACEQRPNFSENGNKRSLIFTTRKRDF